eukprot:CAMPEP_0174905596 /NCGR_PEP_ID=MMETSP0167-20121228/53533_1 /TAXON_ID=38298 /ORGANISM="Rhodella maculata, Strain CCMP736" /LENGTH=143 /DNA_ID=CAMNT_0016148577 /DNA_START=130 /DNA_END=557 /DNA_ORIENTATION=-
MALSKIFQTLLIARILLAVVESTPLQKLRKDNVRVNRERGSDFLLVEKGGEGNSDGGLLESAQSVKARGDRSVTQNSSGSVASPGKDGVLVAARAQSVDDILGGEITPGGVGLSGDGVPAGDGLTPGSGNGLPPQKGNGNTAG